MPQKPHTPGAEARFPFDRMAVERFRQVFRERGGATSAGAGSSQERRPPGGSTVGWKKRQQCWRFTATARDATPSPLIQYQAHTWRCPTTSVFEPRIRRRLSRNCEQYPGPVGTRNCGPGECRSVLLKSYDAVGPASKRPPNRRNRKKGNDDERLPKALMLTRPLNCGTPNAAVIAIHFQLNTYRPLASRLRQKNMALSFSTKCPVNSSRRKI